MSKSPKPEFFELPAACLTSDQSVRQSNAELDELADSLKRVGMLHPIILSDRTGTIVAGTGRLAAARRAGMERVPVLIRPDLADPARRLLARYAENAHRKALTPNEAAQAIAEL
ncbi:MAG TPA: ParB N-terminal domain-containing protein, partial [Planctomycetota bacterium]|nr:ParB N-terminal domain-containing protein [Planctomycetota bacterium]